jgi:hypothetical protein
MKPFGGFFISIPNALQLWYRQSEYPENTPSEWLTLSPNHALIKSGKYFPPRQLHKVITIKSEQVAGKQVIAARLSLWEEQWQYRAFQY